ncbi:hypothetical protein [Janibacter limosus]|uniref:Uncharacterized protein n=1 Tax=Janibacter limosus TaxID=53458 RepID=A0A4P6MX17_9MICO|nr:hypothetical protein [Janibacter limosus]QBF47636.1 hypothetical protein EXU32_16110 [Janibacter limosus]
MDDQRALVGESLELVRDVPHRMWVNGNQGLFLIWRWSPCQRLTVPPPAQGMSSRTRLSSPLTAVATLGEKQE